MEKVTSEHFQYPSSSEAPSAPVLPVSRQAASNSITASTLCSHLLIPFFFPSFLITDFAARRRRERSAAIKATRREAVTQLAQGAKVALRRGGVRTKRHGGDANGCKEARPPQSDIAPVPVGTQLRQAVALIALPGSISPPCPLQAGYTLAHTFRLFQAAPRQEFPETAREIHLFDQKMLLRLGR